VRIEPKDQHVKLRKATATCFLVAFLLSLQSGATVAQDGVRIRINVYRATMQRDAEHLVVREAYTFGNPTNAELTPPGGSLLFDLPHDIHGQVGVTVISGGKRGEGELLPDSTDPSLHRLQLVMGEGNTTVTLSYSLHYADETPFQPRFFYPVDKLQLYVQPEDMQVHGSGATRDAQSPLQGFASWSLSPMTEPGQLQLVLSGGSMMAATPPPEAPARVMPDPREEWKVALRPNRFAEGQTPVLLGLFMATLLGLGLLYGINSGRGASQEHAVRTKVVRDLTRLQDRFVSGQIGREEFLQQRERLLSSASQTRDKAARKRQPVG
jgi:hypothetical protein